MVVCKRRLGEGRAKVAVIVLRWLLVVGNALLSVLGVLRLLSRRAVVVRSNGCKLVSTILVSSSIKTY